MLCAFSLQTVCAWSVPNGTARRRKHLWSPVDHQSVSTFGQTHHGLPRWPTCTKDRSLQESELKCAIREKPRVAVSCRYVIESAPLVETPNSRCAVNAITGECVYLQFFPHMQKEFENCIRMHNTLSESQFICRYSTTHSPVDDCLTKAASQVARSHYRRTPLSTLLGTGERRLHSTGETEKGSAIHDPPSGRPLCGEATPFRSDVT